MAPLRLANYPEGERLSLLHLTVLDKCEQLGHATIALREKLGTEPTDILIDNVIGFVDADRSGTITRDEFERRDATPLFRR